MVNSRVTELLVAAEHVQHEVELLRETLLRRKDSMNVA
jgi:hypothetical protein